MALIISYTALILAQVSIYMYLKNDLNTIDFFNKVNSFFIALPEQVKNNESVEKDSEVKISVIKVDKEQACTDYLLLDKSLKHLEFIAQFESYLESKNSEKFSLEFLQEFENIKREAQITTIRTTQQLNSTLALAA